MDLIGNRNNLISKRSQDKNHNSRAAVAAGHVFDGNPGTAGATATTAATEAVNTINTLRIIAAITTTAKAAETGIINIAMPQSLRAAWASLPARLSPGSWRISPPSIP